MSEPRETEPKRSGDWLITLAKIFAFLVIGTFVLAVLAFGTCLLLARH